ncbi:MAG TPA: hypothetical protein V6C95_06050 [Coleofasciculaceae cyanobacterium]
MCNYMTGVVPPSPSGNRDKSSVLLSSPFPNNFTVKLESEEDNRGSGR